MDKKEDIRRLIRLSGNKEQAAKVLDFQLTALQAALSDAEIPQDFWDDLRSNLSNLDTLEDDLVEIYDNRLSHEAVLWAIKLYSSPEGGAYLRAMAEISEDAMAVGKTWGEKVTKETMAKHGLLPN